MGHSCTSARERKLSRIADRIDQVLLDGLAESVDPSVTLVQYLMKTYKNVVLDSLDFADIRQWLILNPNHFDQLNREMMEVESSIKWGQLQLNKLKRLQAPLLTNKSANSVTYTRSTLMGTGGIDMSESSSDHRKRSNISFGVERQGSNNKDVMECSAPVLLQIPSLADTSLTPIYPAISHISTNMNESFNVRQRLPPAAKDPSRTAAILSDFTKILTAAALKHLDELLKDIACQLMFAFDCEAACYLSINSEKKEFALRMTLIRERDGTDSTAVLLRTDIMTSPIAGVAGDACHSGEIIYIDDVGSESRFVSTIDGYSSTASTGNLVSIPLTADMHRIGCIQLFNRHVPVGHTEAYDVQDRGLVLAFTSIAARFLDLCMALYHSRVAGYTNSILHRTAERLLLPFSMEDIGQECIECVKELCRAEQCTIDWQISDALIDAKPLRTTNGALISAPIAIQDRKFGVIKAQNRKSGVFTEDDLKFLTQVSNICALGLIAREMECPDDISSSTAIRLLCHFVDATDFARLLDVVQVTICDIMKCEAVQIKFTEREQELLMMMSGTDRAQHRLDSQKGLAAYVVRSGESLNVPFATQHPLYVNDVDKPLVQGATCMLYVPLNSGRLIGVLILTNGKSTPTFSMADVRKANKLASILAVSIMNYAKVTKTKGKDKYIDDIVEALSAARSFPPKLVSELVASPLQLGERSLEPSGQNFSPLAYYDSTDRHRFSHTMSLLLLRLMTDMNLVSGCSIPYDTLCRFILLMERSYGPTTLAYVVDSVQYVYRCVTTLPLVEYGWITMQEILSLVLAAVCAAQPRKGFAALSATEPKDLSLAVEAFTCDQTNILIGLGRDEASFVCLLIRDVISLSALDRAIPNIERIKQILTSIVDPSKVSSNKTGAFDPKSNMAHRRLLLSLLFTCSLYSFLSRSWTTTLRWLQETGSDHIVLGGGAKQRASTHLRDGDREMLNSLVRVLDCLVIPAYETLHGIFNKRAPSEFLESELENVQTNRHRITQMTSEQTIESQEDLYSEEVHTGYSSY